MVADVSGGGVYVEDHGVARGEHADAVVDDGFGGVGAGGDGADDAIGGAFDEGEAVIAGHGLWGEDLGAWGAGGGEVVFLDLVSDAPEASFLDGASGEVFFVLEGDASHVGDHTGACFKGALAELFEGAASGEDGLVDGVEESAAGGVV